MIVQARVLIMFEADPMLRAGRPRQKRSGGPTMQIVNNVVMCRAKVTRDPCARSRAVARNGNYSVGQVRAIENRCDPVFQQNVDLRVRQEAAQGEERRRREHCVADRAQPHDQYTPHG